MLLAEHSTQRLQERLAEDGYLLFRGLLPRDKVLALRKRIATELRDLRWIDSHQASESGTVVSVLPEASTAVDPHDWPIFDRVQMMEEFHALPHLLLGALGRVFGEAVLMHPRHICRVHFPGQGEHRTLPHQDYPYVQGSARTVTNWCPLGDVPASMGPLAVLVGSHRHGAQPLIRGSSLASESSAAPLMADVSRIRDSCEWATADFQAGDVLTFSAYTVHMGLTNSSDEVRLSMDCRAQPLSDEVSARALTPNWERQVRSIPTPLICRHPSHPSLLLLPCPCLHWAHSIANELNPAAAGSALLQQLGVIQASLPWLAALRFLGMGLVLTAITVALTVIIRTLQYQNKSLSNFVQASSSASGD